MNSHFPASQNSNYSSLQRDKWIYLQSQFAVQAHICTMKCMMNDDESMTPSIFLSQSMGFDISSKHKRKDKQSSVIFNKGNLVKGSKQNLSSVYTTHKRNKFKYWAFEGMQWEKSTLRYKKPKPKQNKKSSPYERKKQTQNQKKREPK